MNGVNTFIDRYRNYAFLLLLIAVYLFLDYQTILFLRPQGIHFIRQTDSLSFVANYYKNGMDFFQPQVFNLLSTDGRAASEFPILYYVTAIFYHLFDEHEFILRLLTILIASAGFLHLFKLLHMLLQDFAYALAFSFLFISSTVLLYYTNNFLPDASALGLTLIGWYYFFSYIKNGRNKNPLAISFLFFSLASLIKVSYFINPVTAILSIMIYDFSLRNGIKNALKINLTPLIVFIFSLFAISSWNIYVLYYNKMHHADYFLNHAVPIWIMSKSQVAEVWENITHYWYSKYYYQSTFHAFLLIIISGFLLLRKSERIILIPSFILGFGSICYVLLFFGQFKDHDYYFIALIPAITILTVNSFIAIKNKFPGLINNMVAKILLSALCILSLNYAREKLAQRYKGTYDIHSRIGFKLSGTRHYLDSLGIPQKAKFIIMTDQTPNGGLYFINRQGWRLNDTTESNIQALKSYIDKGAEYLLITDKKYDMHNCNGLRIGDRNGILIYKLKNGKDDS